ncbi:MFS general substrate transporter [Penicillium alfredii]|uniref:MFS general substrate transporter n=1 Tax=Penicillium alfredii TaxID=1506179 RepID=A0A9W9G8T4_9EURO|nr:MFS general substrate transporter [Penicillium alfredii]KAJ5114280.1 MFS general substrate transporter [Penicillium alfredii]
MGPVFFLPQTATTSYWALAMPDIALVTLGPDLSFAAASIFITSSVPKSFQGSAGSVLVIIQNLAAAVMTAIGDSIGERVSSSPGYQLDLAALRSIWWFSLGCSELSFARLLCGSLAARRKTMCSKLVQISRQSKAYVAKIEALVISWLG